jgi:hypothetical protein
MHSFGNQKGENIHVHVNKNEKQTLLIRLKFLQINAKYFFDCWDVTITLL